MKQQNCHARSKQKRKALRQKNRLTALHERRISRLLPEKPKGKTHRGSARDIAVDMHELFPNNDFYWNSGNTHGRYLNQRQKRKRIRQANGYSR